MIQESLGTCGPFTASFLTGALFPVFPPSPFFPFLFDCVDGNAENICGGSGGGVSFRWRGPELDDGCTEVSSPWSVCPDSDGTRLLSSTRSGFCTSRFSLGLKSLYFSFGISTNSDFVFVKCSPRICWTIHKSTKNLVLSLLARVVSHSSEIYFWNVLVRFCDELPSSACFWTLLSSASLSLTVKKWRLQVRILAYSGIEFMKITSATSNLFFVICWMNSIFNF